MLDTKTKKGDETTIYCVLYHTDYVTLNPESEGMFTGR
jgi:hypothetical protein